MARLIGKSSNSPILGTRVYQVEYPDGAVAEYSANVIAKNILSHADGDGHNFSYLSEILGHRSIDEAFIKEHGHVRTKSEVKPIITTQGWELYVKWKDQSIYWVRIKEFKESNPVELAKYAVANNIHTESAFNWWVNYTLRKRKRSSRKLAHVLRSLVLNLELTFQVLLKRHLSLTVAMAMIIEKKQLKRKWTR